MVLKQSSMKVNKANLATGSVLALIHLVLVAWIYYGIVYAGNPDATYGWMLMIFVDFPVSLGLGIRSLQREGDYIWNNGTLPGLYFGILGTMWWFGIGYALSWTVQKVLRPARVGD